MLPTKSQSTGKLGKFFDARQKLNDLESLKKYLQKFQLTRQDYESLLQTSFQNYREKFIKIIQIFKAYEQNIFDLKIKDLNIFAYVCKFGTAQQIQNLLKLQNIKILDKKNQSLIYVLQNIVRKGERIQALQIAKILLNVSPKLISDDRNKNIVLQSFEKQQFQLAQLLIENGAQLTYQSPDRQNLLHILMKNFNKKFQKQILNIRNLLIQKGIDEKKTNVNAKRPYQLCPPQVQKRILQQHKSQTNARKNKGEENMRYNKGKSEQGSEFGRARNSQYRQKHEPSVLVKINQKQQIPRVAENCVQKRLKQKQKQLSDREKERFSEKSRQKDREKKQKINKKVFTPDQLKYFLNEQIKLFMEQIQRQNEYQKSFLHELIEKITSKIKQNMGATIKVFGSFATQLCLYESDIDMVIIPNDQKEIESSFALLQKISYLLQTMTQEVQSVKFIKTASIPVIKIQCSKKYDSKKIDITYKDQNHNGLDSVQLIQKYLAIYTQLRPLVFVLKKFIYSTNIYDPYSGGLSSYGLILMIVAYLQNQNRQRKVKGGPDSQKIPSIAQLLIGFLYYYGFKCNYISKQICILDAQKAKIQMEANYLQKYFDQPIYVDAMDLQVIMYPNDWQPRAKLMIVDPLNPKNNIGRATHKIRQIKTAFQMAYVCIHIKKNCKMKKSCESYQKIMNLNLKQTKCENYKRPCCIIKRMMHSTTSFTAA